jgi:hypothetical protein
MSRSNNAILAFGFSVEEDKPSCLDDENALGGSYENFEDLMVAKLLKKPSTIFEHNTGKNSPEWSDYYKKAQEIKTDCCLTLEWFCSYEYPMYFIALKETVTTAHRSNVESVNTYHIKDEKLEKFKQTCINLGIAYKEPKWCIFSMNG